jgi:hypothetical protein
MPVKRRGGSKARAMQVTPKAIALYERGLRLLARGEDHALNTLSYELAAELGLRPWHTCPLDTVSYSAAPDWMRSQVERDDWHRSAGIRDQLEEALRDRRRAQREARPSGGTPDQPLPS